MSIAVELHELAEAAGRYRFAYLLTVGDDGRPHAVAVSPVVEGEVLVVATAGRRTTANAGARTNVSLVYPPVETDGYSLIVDASSAVVGDAIHLSPTRAVLHRPAPGQTGDTAGSCESDCVPIPLES